MICYSSFAGQSRASKSLRWAKWNLQDAQSLEGGPCHSFQRAQHAEQPKDSARLCQEQTRNHHLPGDSIFCYVLFCKIRSWLCDIQCKCAVLKLQIANSSTVEAFTPEHAEKVPDEIQSWLVHHVMNTLNVSWSDGFEACWGMMLQHDGSHCTSNPFDLDSKASSLHLKPHLREKDLVNIFQVSYIADCQLRGTSEFMRGSLSTCSHHAQCIEHNFLDSKQLWALICRFSKM